MDEQAQCSLIEPSSSPFMTKLAIASRASSRAQYKNITVPSMLDHILVDFQAKMSTVTFL